MILMMLLAIVALLCGMSVLLLGIYYNTKPAQKVRPKPDYNGYVPSGATVPKPAVESKTDEEGVLSPSIIPKTTALATQVGNLLASPDGDEDRAPVMWAMNPAPKPEPEKAPRSEWVTLKWE